MPTVIAANPFSAYVAISVAARMLEQSEATVRRLVDLGRLRAIRDLNNR